MKLASEIKNGSREELLAYLKSWDFTGRDSDSDFELRLAAHRNFQREGPGLGSPQVMGNAAELVMDVASRSRVT